MVDPHIHEYLINLLGISQKAVATNSEAEVQLMTL